MNSTAMPYRKHVYWLTRDEESLLRNELASARDIALKSAKGIVCTPLDRLNKIASVAPEVWNETCRRQGSWYRNSEKCGLYLIVSSFDIQGWEHKKACVIEESDFVPAALAGDEEKRRMVGSRGFKHLVPDDWKYVNENEKRIYLRWASRLGSDADDYDFLYLTHTANHANFINPAFYIEKKGEIIPYSLDRSAHVCSCCLELFQVLGGHFNKKFIVPCPGATIFARLEADRYLLVTGTRSTFDRS